MIELVRRVTLYVGVMLGLLCTVWTQPALLRVEIPDFQRSLDRRPRFGEAPPPLDEFIAQKLKGSTIQGTDPRLADLRRQLEDFAAGKSMPSEFTRRLAHDFVGNAVFYRLSDAPLASVASNFSDDNAFSYIAVKQDGATQYLGVTWTRPGDAMHYAPGALLYPFRWAAIPIAGAGFLVYLLLPWRRRPANALYFKSGRATVVPDFLGLALFGMFFILPFLIMSDISPDYTPADALNLRSGMILFSCIFWIFCILFATIPLTSLLYCTYELQIAEGRLVRYFGWSRMELDLADWETAEPARYSIPTWVKVIGWLVALSNWRAIAPTLMLYRDWNLVALKFRDGQSLKIGMHSLLNGRLLLDALRSTGRPVPDAVVAALEGSPVPAPARARIAFAVFGLILALAGFGLWAWVVGWVDSQPAVTAYKPIELPDPAAMQRREQLLLELTAAQKESERAAAAYKNAAPADQAAALKRMREADAKMAALVEKATQSTDDER